MDQNNSTTEERLIHSLIKKSLILFKSNQNIEVFEEFIHSRFGDLQFKIEIDKINNEDFDDEDLVLTFSVIVNPKFNCRKRLFIGKKDDVMSFLEKANSSNVRFITEDLPNYYRMLFDY